MPLDRVLCRLCGHVIDVRAPHITAWSSLETGILCPTNTGEITGHLPLVTTKGL